MRDSTSIRNNLDRPQTARRLPIGLPRDREPTRDDLRNVPRGIALIHFRIVERFEGS